MGTNNESLTVLTIPEVAEKLRVSVNTIRRLISSGKLPAKQVGNQWRVSQSLLADYLTDVAPSETDKLREVLANRRSYPRRRAI